MFDFIEQGEKLWKKYKNPISFKDAQNMIRVLEVDIEPGWRHLDTPATSGLNFLFYDETGEVIFQRRY
ncbi:MAG: hypothetical protein PHN88_09160 [Ignavibacteria bacterium]|nr:hypothetical protein [Ignavibacteria bacterium]